MKEELENILNIGKYIEDYVPQKLFAIGLIPLTNAITRINKSANLIKLRYINPNKCIEFVAQHLQEESLWATQVSFRDSQQAKSLESIFIDLDLFVSPIKLRIETTESIDKIPSSTLLASSLENIILLGQPGAGKTTSVKKIFVELILKNMRLIRHLIFL
ncbi:MAG: hypothetical protein IPN15_05380 [Saprospiraceae bacterium]|nr:hypothetical protein [Candidatus Vicinibacter affinis]